MRLTWLRHGDYLTSTSCGKSCLMTEEAVLDPKTQTPLEVLLAVAPALLAGGQLTGEEEMAQSCT